MLTVNGVKERVRRLGLMLGDFQSLPAEEDPQKDLNSILMANIPTANEDFDPFKYR